MPRISIIIPAYNVEEYLARCLDSIVAIGCDDLEIIIVNDGSKDSTEDIALNYSQQHPFIKVISQPNAGVSGARNRGISEATGTWIGFLDADDTVDSEYYGSLLTSISDEYDFIWGGYSNIEMDGVKTNPFPGNVIETLNINDAIKGLFISKYNAYQGYIFNKLYKSSILKSNHIKFDPTIKYNEDRLFNFTYLAACKNGGKFISLPIYNYWKREGSAMSSLRGPKYKNFITDLIAFEKMYHMTQNDENLAQFSNIVRKRLELSFHRNVNLMISNKDWNWRYFNDSFSIVKRNAVFPDTIIRIVRLRLGYIIRNFKSKIKARLEK